MTVFDDLSKKFGKHYMVSVKCSNCGTIQDCKIPRGELKEKYLKDGGICENCGCIGVLKLREEEVKKRRDNDREKLWEI